MARKIDYAALDADDLQYLADRNWLIAEGDYQGFETSAAVAAWRADGTVPEPAPADDDDDDDDEGIEYKDAKVAELRAELERRELPTDGKKDELVARLEAHDAESEDDEDDEDIEEEEIPEEEVPES